MRRVLVILLWIAVAGPASAVDSNLSDHRVRPDKGSFVGDARSDTREGGESWDDAVPVPSLPYTDSGATCDNRDDITLPCAASAAPDVVYSFVPTSGNSIDVSLCGSGYDTALAIYDGNHNNIACNDDDCGLQSEVENIFVAVGQTYYIVVDGFSTNCGGYVITITENLPCVLECPPGGIPEGEPGCGLGYYDDFNGGCNTSGWSTICPTIGNSAVICGQSGTYLYTPSYRDTDWYRCVGIGATMTATCRAEFPVQLIFIYGIDCQALQYELTTAEPCEDAVLSRYVDRDVEVWIWAGCAQFNGVPCWSDYILTMDGIGEASGCVNPAETSSWGAIKSRFTR